MMGLFSGELILRGAYYWRKFCVSKWVGLEIKRDKNTKTTGLNQLKTVNPKIPWAYIQVGLLSERYLRLRFGGWGGGGGGIIFLGWGKYYGELRYLLRSIGFRTDCQVTFEVVTFGGWGSRYFHSEFTKGGGVTLLRKR